VRKSFTLIEAILVIVILSFILIGGFQIISKIYERNFIAVTSAKFNQKSQQTADFLSGMLYSRIPLTAIGYDTNTGDFKYIGDIEDADKYKVFEWISECSECKRELNLSGFLDLYKSDRDKNLVVALDFNSNFIKDVLKNKFNIELNDSGIIFAGTFDRGEEASLFDYNNSFGWHGNKHKYVATITDYSQDGNDCNLTINYKGERIYEKFFLVDSAYAIALKKDLNQSLLSQCKDLNLSKLGDNTLLLFYNYRPWEGETFCADNRGEHSGNVTVLLNNVKAFQIRAVNSHLELLLDLIKQKSNLKVEITKQKVIF